ncbi:MAG: hypothetical protein U1F49_13155 [Rubrivivax sp.]
MHIVGDSVVLSAQPLLQRTIARAVVDAEVGRQAVFQAQQLLRQRMSAWTLRPNVVLHTGTNGYLHRGALPRASSPRSPRAAASCS